MAIEVIVHIHNSDPILGEIDELPKSTDTMIKVKNPRFRDGREVHYISQGVDIVYWPINQLSFLEVVASEKEDQIFGFVRE
ncbi:MAG: hypothetical protein ABFS03_08540 [Chloroflexota bacterium]